MKRFRKTVGWERVKSICRTLRFRLMLWNAAIVVLTAIATMVGLREGVRRALVHELDQILIEDIREIEMALRESHPPNILMLREELHRKARGHKHHDWFVELRDAQDQIEWSSGNVPQPIVLRKPTANLQPVSAGGFRFVDYRLAQPQAGIGRIRVGENLALLQEDVARIDRLTMIAAGVVLLLGPLFGYWLAGRATRPVAEILQTASRLRPHRLDERLPIRGTGDELDQIATTVNEMLDRIAEYLAQKHDFLANAAHELRTPLAAIRSSIEVTLGQPRPPEEYEELLGEIIEESAALESLVNQLLLLSETESDRLETVREHVQFDLIVTKSVDMFRGVAESQDVALRIDRLDRCPVNGNRHHLRQIINNLLDNAIKFTPAGGVVTVSLKADGDTHTAILSVDDTGCGIPPDDVDYIFHRFFRGDRSRSRGGGAKGTGLGLSICHAAVAAHGGNIQAVSRVAEGTTMTVRLPLEDEYPQPSPPRSQAAFPFGIVEPKSPASNPTAQ